MIETLRCTFLTAACGLLLSACAGTPPLDLQGVNRELSVREVLNLDQEAEGRRILWGGVIVRSKNLEHDTELEILAYPLNRDLRPNTRASSQGRFLIEHAGYLETVDFAPGRAVSVVGIVQGIRKGKVDKAPYRFPMVSSEQLKLWPVKERRREGSPVHFGIGVGFGF